MAYSTSAGAKWVLLWGGQATLEGSALKIWGRLKGEMKRFDNHKTLADHCHDYAYDGVASGVLAALAWASSTAVCSLCRSDMRGQIVASTIHGRFVETHEQVRG